ncbi:uncharacterized protein [Primulina huaijiensis]|uniref:uncharacterized protein isoform X2 n=1 Tax=Primulina huaijiensis TaxID=1492673 RepID=UPI003CC72707
MAEQQHGSPPADGRTLIWVADGIFMPEHNKVIRFLTAQFSLQTCDEGNSWKNVTEEQRQWYWEEFAKKYTWPDHLDATIRQLWYKNIATQYHRTIHSWRSAGRHPQTVSNKRWASWMLAWNEEMWLDRAAKNKENGNSEPTGPGTGTTKHVAGSKTYSGHSPKLQAMQANMNESLTPLDDGTIPSQPSSEEVNSMVVGGSKKGRTYGFGSVASTFYPDQMARRPRGGSSSSSGGSQDMERMREEWETQKRVNEHLRIDLKATQITLEATQHENTSLKDRMTILEDQVRQLVAGLPQPQPHPHPRTSRRVLYGRGSSNRGRALAGSSHFDDSYATGSSHRRRSGKGLMYLLEYIPPSQDFGHDDGDGDSDDAYDDDETRSP